MIIQKVIHIVSELITVIFSSLSKLKIRILILYAKFANRHLEEVCLFYLAKPLLNGSFAFAQKTV